MTPNEVYSILGLTSEASEREVKAKYRDLVKILHPDKFGSDERLGQAAGDQLKRVNEAYDLIKSAGFNPNQLEAMCGQEEEANDFAYNVEPDNPVSPVESNPSYRSPNNAGYGFPLIVSGLVALVSFVFLHDRFTHTQHEGIWPFDKSIRVTNWSRVIASTSILSAVVFFGFSRRWLCFLGAFLTLAVADPEIVFSVFKIIWFFIKLILFRRLDVDGSD